jgi:hypothetical protein
VQILQILQVILFSIPTLTLLGMGIVILSHSVSIIDRRIYLSIFIPLLLANTLALFEGAGIRLYWRTWLILGADLVLILGIVWFSHGFQVYGLTAEMAVIVMENTFRQQGYTVYTEATEKHDLWGRTRAAYLLTAQKTGEAHLFWIISRFNEVSIRAKKRTDTGHLHKALPALRQQKVPYDFKAHAIGVLYIVLALVFAVLTWIFFFEPRLILIE